MKPQQIEAAIQELLKEIEGTSRPANEVINAYTRHRRYIGSKDRHALTEGVWAHLRLRPVPKWIMRVIDETELQAMKQPAEIVLRANGNRGEIQKKLAAQGIETEKTKHSPWGLILKKRVNLSMVDCYRMGWVEVQDEGSQLVALATHISPKEEVLDYCAGAGGKSLCFAQMMHNQGRIVAHDVSRISLKELNKRAQRAKVSIIQTTLFPKGQFNQVVVDAPCSGSGTWRRCPDAPFKLTPQQVADLIKKQAQILDKASSFVALNGKLHYMTCSLIQGENQDQMRGFLKRHPEFKLVHHQQWTPAKNKTDGFFLATFECIKKIPV